MKKYRQYLSFSGHEEEPNRSTGPPTFIPETALPVTAFTSCHTPLQTGPGTMQLNAARSSCLSPWISALLVYFPTRKRRKGCSGSDWDCCISPRLSMALLGLVSDVLRFHLESVSLQRGRVVIKKVGLRTETRRL